MYSYRARWSTGDFVHVGYSPDVRRRFLMALGVAVAIATAGCSDAPDDDDSSGMGTAIAVTLSEVIPTVATVRWTPTSGHDGGYVDFGGDSCADSRAPAIAEENGDLSALLVGMKPSTECCLRAMELHGGVAKTVGEEVLFTGGLPPEIEAPILALHDPAAAEPGFILTAIASALSYAVVLDPDGDIVWWHQPQVHPEGAISRLRLSRDRTTLMYLATVGLQILDHDVGQRLLRVQWDGTELAPLQTPDAHHDFVELPDGSMGFIVYDSREVYGDLVHGDRIVEYRPNGTEVEVFTVWDHFAYDPDSVAHPALGWTHANALHHDEAEDAYYLSLHNLDTVLKIDRSSGDLLWQLGGDASDFATDGPLFQRQHQIHPLENGNLLLFANGMTELQNSRAVEIALDEQDWTAEVTWEHEAEPSLYVYSFGDIQRLPAGATAITWSTSGRIDQVTPDHDVAAELLLPLGYAFGYSEWFETLYL